MTLLWNIASNVCTMRLMPSRLLLLAYVAKHIILWCKPPNDPSSATAELSGWTIQRLSVNCQRPQARFATGEPFASREMELPFSLMVYP